MSITENNSFETNLVWHDVDEVKPFDGQWVLAVNLNQVYTCRYVGEHFEQTVFVNRRLKYVNIDCKYWADFPEEIDNL